MKERKNIEPASTTSPICLGFLRIPLKAVAKTLEMAQGNSYSLFSECIKSLSKSYSHKISERINLLIGNY